MAMPQLKVNITHGATSTDYTPAPFSTVKIKRRESNYDVATLVCGDQQSKLYLDNIDTLDEIKIYFKDAAETAYKQAFGGYVRQANPNLGNNNSTLGLACKGYGVALEETHCNTDYGIESSNNGLSTAKTISEHIIDYYTNLSFAVGAHNTNWNVLRTNGANDTIANVAGGATIKYINNPYRTCLETVDIVCDLTSAIGAGATAGAHWIVDNNNCFILNTIGTHEDTAEWPDWWNVDEAGSTLTQGIDFSTYQVLDKAEEFANNLLLVTDFRRPAYDYWTEDSGGAALWTNDGLEAVVGITNDGTVGPPAHFVVGSHSVKFDPDGGVIGYGYYPAASANWDVRRWGSDRTIPRVNFYAWKHLLTTATTYIYMSTNDAVARKTDYYYATFFDWTAETDDTWYHKSIPIGPYWATTEEAKQFRWVKQGNANWADIDTIEFVIAGAGVGGYLLVDDLHFSGKIIRSARNAASIAANKEYQKVLISRNAMDDSCVAGVGAGKDDGFAARMAYAELLRRQVLPTTISFTVAGKPRMMAGQKCHVHACKQLDGGFSIDYPMRIVEVQHDWNAQSFTTTVTATSDLLNTRATGLPDQYAMYMENLFLNSNEAKNIRSGAEVDLHVPILESNY